MPISRWSYGSLGAVFWADVWGVRRGCDTAVVVELGTRTVLFTVDEPQFNHDAGEVAFGPDGFLYFTLGDGGGAHDGLADDPPSHGPIGNGQNIETTLGSILRIDVDHRTVCHRARTLRLGTAATGAHLAHGDTIGACTGSATGLYRIPADNPFASAPGADEIYAYGLRNPYKFSFDDGPGGDGALYLADVGQNLFEEVNIIERGGNYGWVIKEGFHCFDPFNPLTAPAACSATGPRGEPLIDPIVEYAHPGSGFSPEIGISVIGGFVYRGSESAGLVGKYFFGDFAQDFFTPSGTLLFVDDPAGPGPVIEQFQIGLEDRPYGLFLKGFGEDEDGEVYACGSTALAPVGTTGVCQRIVAVD